MKYFLLLLAFVTTALAGCHVPVKQLKPAVEDEGETYVYVRPLSQDAEPLRFSLETVAAVRENGVEIPLDLRLPEFSLNAVKRQRLLASKPLPPGKYMGFSVKAKSAIMKGPEGESALLVPKEPTKVLLPFEVRKGKGLLVSFSFNYEQSVNGIHFNPVFSAVIPGRPLPTLTGYVTNYGANTITVFDKHTCEAMDIIQTGRGPAGIVIDQKQRRAYVVLAGEDAIDVIDVEAGSVVNRIQLTPGDNPRDLAITPDGSTLVCANPGSNTLSIIDPIALVESARVNLAKRPDTVIIDRAGKRAYIFNNLYNNITVFDIANRVVVATITTDTAPVRGDFSKAGDRLAIFHEWSPYLMVFDTVSLAMQKRIYDEIGIGWLKIDTVTDRIYVGKKQGPTVEIFDPISFFPVDSFTMDGGVSFMTIDGEENNLYLLIPDKKMMQIINLVSRQTVGEIDLDDNPYWVTLMGER